MVERYDYIKNKDISTFSVNPTGIPVGVAIIHQNFKMAADLSGTEKEALEALLQASIK